MPPHCNLISRRFGTRQRKALSSVFLFCLSFSLSLCFFLCISINDHHSTVCNPLEKYRKGLQSFSTSSLSIFFPPYDFFLFFFTSVLFFFFCLYSFFFVVTNIAEHIAKALKLRVQIKAERRAKCNGLRQNRSGRVLSKNIRFHFTQNVRFQRGFASFHVKIKTYCRQKARMMNYTRPDYIPRTIGYNALLHIFC